MTSFILETIIELSAAIRYVNAQLVLMNRGLTSTYIMLIWMILWDPLIYLFHWGTRVLVDNIFVFFAGEVFQQTVGIPMGTNCAPLLADIFLYSYEADVIQSLLSTGKKHLASRFNLTNRYIDDVLSINNPEFENYLGQMYPAELEIKDTTESTTSASYLDLLLSIGRDGQLHTSIYDKRDDFNFHITNFLFLSSNIPSSPAYGVFISQLIRYDLACSSYECFYSEGQATFK